MELSIIKSKNKLMAGMRSLPWNVDLFSILFKQLPACYRREDALLHRVVVLTLLVGIALHAMNDLFFHFSTLHFRTSLVTAIPGIVVVWLIGTLLYERYPRMGLLFSSFSQAFLFLLVVGYALSEFLTTPFSIIDGGLQHFNEAFKISTLGLMHWTYHHVWLQKYLTFCYDTWFFQLVLTPLALACFNDRSEIDRYFLATFISFLIGGVIYYLWPTIAPAGILTSPYFNQAQHDLVLRFNEIHHHLPVTIDGGGVIAFPSFHVINCLLVMLAWRRYFWVFLPLLVINVGSIFSTMALGYHYLADVLAGFLLVYFSFWLSKRALAA